MKVDETDTEQVYRVDNAKMRLKTSSYTGRFAPSPTGPLHAGSLVAALASWLDARAHRGTWLVRMEDIDEPRCKRQFAEQILGQLAAHGMVSDGPVLTQSQRKPLYEAALAHLINAGLAYPCSCSRKQIMGHWVQQGMAPGRHQDLVYPGSCRPAATAMRLSAPVSAPGQQWAWRFHVSAWQNRDASPVPIQPLRWTDRGLGEQSQDLAQAVGDFVLKRADGFVAYQLAVVVDDAHQGISHIVRGQDLADNTARQIALQQALGLRTPTYLHTPLVLGTNGEKLSKQNGAQALANDQPLHNLQQAAQCLGLARVSAASTPAELLRGWVQQWQQRHCLQSDS